MVTSPQITASDRAIIALAIELGCSISAEMERGIRRDERAQVVARLRETGVVAISPEPSRCRVATRRFPAVDTLEAEIRRDEGLLMVRAP